MIDWPLARGAFPPPPPPPLKCWPITVVSAPKERASEPPPLSSVVFHLLLILFVRPLIPSMLLGSVSAAPLNGRGEARGVLSLHKSPDSHNEYRYCFTYLLGEVGGSVRSPPRRRRRPTWQALERGSQVNLNVRSMDRLRSTDEKKVARIWSGTAFKVHSAPCQQSNSGTIQKDRSLGRSVGVSGGLIFTLAAAPRSARSPISARSTVVRSWLLLNKRRPNAS